MLLAALGLGLLIGLVIGALGGGGSVLTVPLLVFVLGQSPQEATSNSLFIVGVTAAVAAAGHARRGSIRWGTGLQLAAAGLPASVVGAGLNRRLDPDLLLLAFAALLLVAATGMVLRADPADAPPVVRVAAPCGRSSRGTGLRLALTGLGIGFLTGLFGVGGGFIVVPVLVLLLAVPLVDAVGTSLLVIALNSAVALAVRIGHGSVQWQVVVPFTLAAVAASFAGGTLAARVRARSLTRAFAVLLLVIAVYVAVRALT